MKTAMFLLKPMGLFPEVVGLHLVNGIVSFFLLPCELMNFQPFQRSGGIITTAWVSTCYPGNQSRPVWHTMFGTQALTLLLSRTWKIVLFCGTRRQFQNIIWLGSINPLKITHKAEGIIISASLEELSYILDSRLLSEPLKMCFNESPRNTGACGSYRLGVNMMVSHRASGVPCVDGEL